MDLISQNKTRAQNRARDRDRERDRDRNRDRDRHRDQASIDVVCCYVLCLGLAGLALVPCLASQAKAKHIATNNNNNERGLAFGVWAGGGRRRRHCRILGLAVSLPLH